MHCPSPRTRNPAGFTLLELSAVLMIIAVIIAGTISTGNSVIASAQLASTNSKLDVIENALIAFRMANNRLPCPTDATLADDPAHAATYGYEAGYVTANSPVASCGGGNPVSNFYYSVPSPGSNTNIPGGTTVAEGAVPVRTLGLPDEFQFDAWGRKFSYAVWTPLTAKATSTTSPAAFVNYGISQNCGAITVENAGHGNRSTSAAYVLLSYGPDGHGGYLKSGTPMSSGSDNADELTNCHCTSSLAGNPSYAATYVEQVPTQTSSTDPNSVFDDIVRFKERWQLQNVYDTYNPNGAPCWPGFRIDGISGGDHSGSSVAVGDVNGDGIPDLIIGVPSRNSNTGSVYVVFGTRSGFPDPLPLSTLNGTNGFELDGVSAGDNTGYSVAVGDINGDGTADIIASALNASPGGNSNAGSTYVVFGGSTRKDGTAWTSCPCTMITGFLNGTNGFRLDGVTAGDESGWAVAASDINGDGIADVIIGAIYASPGGKTKAGSTYVVFGSRSAWPSTMGLSSLNGTNGFRLDGENGLGQGGDDGTTGDQAGASLAAADVNGDGIADLIIGANTASPNTITKAGAAYVVFGQKSGWPATMGLSTLNGSNGFRLNGVSTQDFTGWTVAAGDINGDGIADVIVAGNFNDGAGSVYVVFGKAGGWSSSNTLNAGFLDGTNGFRLNGQAMGDYMGWSLAAADVNGDGKADLIIESPFTNGGPGSIFVVFGKASGWSGTPATLNDAYLNGTNGSELAAPVVYSGGSVASTDINGDGVADVITGVPNASPPEGSQAGSTYVYFGKKYGWPPSSYNLGGL